MKYTYNLKRVIDYIFVPRVQNNTPADYTCGFHYTVIKSNVVTQHSPEENLSLKTDRQALLLYHQKSITFVPQEKAPRHILEILSSNGQ